MNTAKSFIYSLFVAILCGFYLVSNTFLAQQKVDSISIEGIKKMIRQSTYYDSSMVFRLGAKAIKLAQNKYSLSDEATIYQYYGNFCYFSNDYTAAKDFYEQSLEYSIQAGDAELTNKTQIRINFILVDENMLQAEKEFNSLLIVAQKNDFFVNQIECLNGLGIICEHRQMLDKAMGYYLKALKIAEQNAITYHEAMLLNNIGLIKLYSKQSEAAAADFEKALKLAYQLKELRLALNLHNNLGLIASDKKDFYGAISHYNKTLNNAHELGFPVAKGVAYLNLSSQYFNIKYYKQALLFVDSSITIFKATNEKNYLPKPYLLKASIYRDSDDLQLAQLFLDTSILYAKQIESSADEIDAVEIQASILARLGDYKLAYEKYKLFHQQKDSVSDINNKDKVAQLQVLYGKEQLEAQLENEKNEKKYQEIKTIYIFSILIIVFLIIAVLIYLRYVFKTRQQQQQFSLRLIENIDEERSRISRDLHDDIGQLLSSIKMKVNLYKSNTVTDIDGLENELGNVIEQTRTISHFLHPSYLEKIGLKRSVAALLEKTQQNSGIVCSLDWNEDVENLTIDVKTQLFRIIQECINNTLKHSEASALKIDITHSGSSYTLKYRDNGKGIGESDNLANGIGLKTIRERVKKINGKINFETHKGKGFKLTLKF